ncbi:MAG: 3-isopropylmalate/(R)-2-methylmalate dehydratase small subunit [Spirochaetes bacterium]|nr:MAG: 3-isopropylmalate/(R)-2-methylmalate dehydratase small subunit [Spirochaetota bacterium]
MKKLKGKVYTFGNNIDTDQIYPGRFLELTDHNDIGKHAMELGSRKADSSWLAPISAAVPAESTRSSRSRMPGWRPSSPNLSPGSFIETVSTSACRPSWFPTSTPSASSKARKSKWT